MPIDPEYLLNRRFPEVRHPYTPRDVMLYALSIGIGADPMDERQLRYVYERDLRVFPSMAGILSFPGLWAREPDTGLDWERVLHAEQGIEFLKPLPTEGAVVARTRVSGLVDKGAGRGALIYTERTGVDEHTGEALFNVYHTAFARGDGGFSDGGVDGFGGPARPPHPLPERPPDTVFLLSTLPQQALLYRLNGDPNPHNADPAAARASGFDRPIMQGLCTYGFAAHAVVAACCDYAPDTLASMHVRRSAPVFPGETIATEIWRDGDVVSFRSRVPERGVTVLDNGRAVLRPGAG
jgi:acyl dehydratase